MTEEKTTPEHFGINDMIEMTPVEVAAKVTELETITTQEGLRRFFSTLQMNPDGDLKTLLATKTLALEKLGTSYTHYNGEKSYRVIQSNTTVRVYVCLGSERVKTDLQQFFKYQNRYSLEPVCTFKPSEFIQATKLSCSKQKDVQTSTRLFEVGLNRYFHIGTQIIEFETIGPIRKFYSPDGENDCPFPYVCTDELTHLLGTDVLVTIPNRVEKGKEILNLASRRVDVYNLFYHSPEVRKMAYPLKYQLLHRK